MQETTLIAWNGNYVFKNTLGEIGHGKKGFIIHPKLIFSLGINLDLNDLELEWMFFVNIMPYVHFVGLSLHLYEIISRLLVNICIIFGVLQHQVSREGLH
jgi:hypothetical protein